MHQLSLTLIAATCLTLAACSKNDSPPSTVSTPAAATGASPVASVAPYDQVASSAKGFTVGALMSAQTVYVLFDPQCPHCGKLWQASLALHNKVKFVWIPIAFKPGTSVSQGAALLTAGNAIDAMTAHEESLLAGKGGMAASADVSSELTNSIKVNTQLLNVLGADSVPFILSKNKSTGQVITHSGAMETAALAEFLGV
jgi:thiol:disulfide interchange protein DsbG